MPDPQPNNNNGGAGTELKKLLAQIGITASPACRCNDLAALMDANGPDWCEANAERVVTWLRDAAAARRLPFVAPVARLLVSRAIARARKKAAAA